MNIQPLATKDFEKLMQQHISSHSFLLYDPIEKKYTICFDCPVDPSQFWQKYQVDERDFFSLPFSQNKKNSTTSYWEGITYGLKHFRYCYEFFYSVSQKSEQTESRFEQMMSKRNKEEDYEDWQKLFQPIMRSIETGQVEKVVVSREVPLPSHYTSKQISETIQNLLRQNSESYVFSYHEGTKTFLGASPEVLIQKNESDLTSYALAGTMSKKLSKDGQELLKDKKNNREHQLVVEQIAANLSMNGGQVQIEKRQVVSLRNLYHLKTTLRSQDPNTLLVDWVKQLHPTPAMGGFPKEAALSLIETYETHDRGLFASPLGMMDKKGNGLFIVGIRSVLVTEDELILYAGCGIVAGSQCQQEYQEIQHKFQTILDALPS